MNDSGLPLEAMIVGQYVKKRRLLWLIPLPGGGGDKDKDGDAKDAEAKDDASSS